MKITDKRLSKLKIRFRIARIAPSYVLTT